MSDSFFLKVSDILLSYTFYIGIPCLILSIVLILGFKLKRTWVAILFLCGLLGLSAWMISMILNGFMSQEILAYERWSDEIYQKTKHPQEYLYNMIVWILAAISTTGFVGWLFIRLWKHGIKMVPQEKAKKENTRKVFYICVSVVVLIFLICVSFYLNGMYDIAGKFTITFGLPALLLTVVYGFFWYIE